MIFVILCATDRIHYFILEKKTTAIEKIAYEFCDGFTNGQHNVISYVSLSHTQLTIRKKKL